MNNNWHKKEKPLLGLTGLGGGVDGLAVVGAATKTYVDDVFSSYVYIGDGTNSHQIVNGIDLSSKGGFIWGKERGNSGSHYQFDTVRGLDKRLKSNSDSAEETDTFYSSVNSDGYTIEKTTSVNISGNDYVSWTFAKQKGFFDIQTWTGNSTADRQISHNLNCIPGCILIKQTSGAAEDWAVYHRGIGSTAALKLNRTNDADTGIEYFQDTDPTATNFTLGIQPPVNGNGNEYVAYIFAGGEEQGNTSVDFDGTDDRLTWDSNSDVNFGTGDFTVEFWLRKPDGGSTHTGFFQISGTGGGLTNSYGSSLGLGWHQSFNCWQLYGAGTYENSSSFTPTANQWYHAAVVRSSGTTKVYIDGSEVISTSDSHNYNYNNLVVGGYYSTSYLMKGQISNFRITKGQALYTSSFTPTTSPLTTTSQSATASNVKLLCCNDTGASLFTKSPSPIILTGSPQGSTVSPFAASTALDASAVFGADGDKNIIKCGSYLGTGSAGLEVNLGWEPSWIIVKSATSAENWEMYDSMRGLAVGGDAERLKSNTSDAEDTNSNWFALTANGFIVNSTSGSANSNGETYIFCAIRRSDGYVAKPPEAGTDVFAMDTGNSSATGPAFDSNFVVDSALLQQPNTAGLDWRFSQRLTGTKSLATNTDAAETTESSNTSDYNDGFADSYTNVWQSWMWKRGQGFDSVAWTGDDVVGRSIPHSLNAVPEMIWVKCRSAQEPWAVYHHGANGGTTPWNYYGKLNMSSNFSSSPNMWNQTAPTSTDFEVIADNMVNGASNTYIAMLFRSVAGISKCGYHTCDAGNTTLTMDFQPRFLLLKNITSGSTPWVVIDSLRGINPGVGVNTPTINISGDSVQSNYTWVNSISSTGLVITAGQGSRFSNDGDSFIWYAHA